MRSADPSPQRTSDRIESFHRMSNERDGYPGRFANHKHHKGNSGYQGHGQGHGQGQIELPYHPPRPASAQAFNHQVTYVCHGHCSGPECEFNQSIRHWQSMVMLEDGQCFQSEVVEKTPLSLLKLDEKRENLASMKEVLAGKLETKKRNRARKKAAAASKGKAASLTRAEETMTASMASAGSGASSGFPRARALTAMSCDEKSVTETTSVDSTNDTEQG